MALRGASGGSSARSRGEERRTLDEFEELAGLRGSGAGSERGAYVLEHLATFTVTRETGIVFPADGMRRLLQLEKTNGEATRSRSSQLPDNINFKMLSYHD